MTDHSDHCPVSDTAALVMLWAGRYYQETPLIRRYVDRLDLSLGVPLLDRYNEICPWYSEVIINRKHFIKDTVITLLKKNDEKTTIINLGAGFSPLGLEILPWLSDDVRLIELDLRNMEAKQQLYSELAPDRVHLISCIETDLSNTDSLIKIVRENSNEQGRTHLIVVMEGLSYYIDRQVMQQVLTSFRDISHHLTFICQLPTNKFAGLRLCTNSGHSSGWLTSHPCNSRVYL